MWKQYREEAARKPFISIVRKHDAMQQLSDEEMVEIHSYSDLIDCERFVRWRTEALGRETRARLELYDSLVAYRFVILADLYQMCCFFRDELYRQMGRAGDLDLLVPFQGKEGCGNSMLPLEIY